MCVNCGEQVWRNCNALVWFVFAWRTVDVGLGQSAHNQATRLREMGGGADLSPFEGHWYVWHLCIIAWLYGMYLSALGIIPCDVSRGGKISLFIAFMWCVGHKCTPWLLYNVSHWSTSHLLLGNHVIEYGNKESYSFRWCMSHENMPFTALAQE